MHRPLAAAPIAFAFANIATAACGASTASAPVEQPLHNADSSDEPDDAEIEPDPAFEALAQELSETLARPIVGWGTVELDGALPRERFAVLASQEAGLGGYFIASGARLWLVEVEVDGRTLLWGADDGTASPPPWRASLDHAIHHSQTHRGGYESTDFALADGELVLRAHEVLEDERDGDTVTRTPYPCAPECTRLDNGSYFGVSMIHGPSQTLDSLLVRRLSP